MARFGIGTRIGDIITQLNTISDITSIFDGGIYNGDIKKPVEGKSYLVIRKLNDNVTVTSDTQGALMKEALVQFYIIGKDANTTDEELHQIAEKITDTIVLTCESGISNYNGFIVNVCEEASESESFIEKDRKFLIKTYKYIYDCND